MSSGIQNAIHKLHFVDSNTKKEIQGILVCVEQLAKPLRSHHIDSQIENIKFQMTSTVLKWIEFEGHLRNLRETIERELGQHFFYRYQLSKAQKVASFEEDWRPVLARFKGVKRDAFSATDCYALGHDNASIYHSMMVLEYGLPALALRLKVPFKPEKSTWGELIRDIRNKIDAEMKARAQAPKGSKPASRFSAIRRTRFLADCQDAAMQFGYFKDVWRNHIAHGRANYDENDALKVLTHVQDFMRILATKLKLGKSSDDSDA